MSSNLMQCVRVLGVAAAMVSAAFGQDPWADRVVSYEAGGTAAPGYDEPLTSLGSPERFTGELAGFPGVVSIFNSPFGTDEIVSIGEGGFLTLAFDEPITNDPAHRFGVDFIIFGNAFFLDADWPNGRIGDPAILAAEGPMRVSVSSDGVDFTSLGDVMEGLFPTQGYLDSGPYDVTRGNVPSDFTRPVDPALSLEDFAGLTFPQVLDLYQGSGGGIPIDIAASGLEAVRFIRIEVFDDGDPNNDISVEIDAISTVPEPASILMLMLGVCICGAKRRCT